MSRFLALRIRPGPAFGWVAAIRQRLAAASRPNPRLASRLTARYALGIRLSTLFIRSACAMRSNGRSAAHGVVVSPRIDDDSAGLPHQDHARSGVPGILLNMIAGAGRKPSACSRSLPIDTIIPWASQPAGGSRGSGCPRAVAGRSLLADPGPAR